MYLEIENLEDYINEIDALVSNHISNSDLLDNPFRIATFYSDESDMPPELLYKLNHRENDLNRTYFTDNCIKYENKIYNDPEDIVNIIYNLMINEAATIVELRFKCYNSAIQKDIQTYLTFDIQPNTINCPRYSIFGWRQYTTDSESYICTKIRNIEYSQILPNQDLRYLKKKKGIAKKVYNITVRSIKESFEFIDSITDISKPTQCEIFYS